MPRKLTTLNGKKLLLSAKGQEVRYWQKIWVLLHFFLKKEVLRRMQAMLRQNLCNEYNPLCWLL